jgi:hypothetical protein
MFSDIAQLDMAHYLQPYIGPWIYVGVILSVWLLLGNMIIAAHVAVYRMLNQPEHHTIPRMERLAANTIRALEAPARHAFPAPWSLIEFIIVRPVELGIRWWYRNVPAQHTAVDDPPHPSLVTTLLEAHAYPYHRRVTSLWRLCIWWLTLGALK